jgi:hypothetical protein
MLLQAEFLAITLVLGLCRRGDGAVSVCGDDAGHQYRDAARTASGAHFPLAGLVGVRSLRWRWLLC